MSFFKKFAKRMPHKATPAELQNIQERINEDMKGLSIGWAIDSLGIENLLPLITIAQSGKTGITRALLHAYTYGYLAGKGGANDGK